MTTPSKLSLKKKIRQKLGSVPDHNNGEDEKENISRGSDNLSARSSRRCSTIIAGNLGLGGVIRAQETLSMRGARPRTLGVLEESGERRESGGGIITEDESSFYSCQESPAEADTGRMNPALASAVAENTWMTEVTEREHRGISTPDNQPRVGEFT